MSLPAAFFRQPAEARHLTLKLLPVLFFWRIVLLVIPFSHLCRYLGERIPETEETSLPTRKPSEAERAEIARLATVLHRVSLHLPGICTCLVLAFTASRRLRRRGYQVHTLFGMGTPGPAGAMQAHAWTVCLGGRVTGGLQANAFHVVGVFQGDAIRKRKHHQT